MIVVPGTVLGGVDTLKNKISGPYVVVGSNIVATTVSIVEKKGNILKITPLAGIYTPRKDDIVIGKIVDVLPNGWMVEFGVPYHGFMLLKDALYEHIDPLKDDLNNYFTYRDFIAAKIVSVTKNKIINLSVKGKGLGKLEGGLIISINTKKIPRVIGKNKSMLNIIQSITNVKMVVGVNGRIWIKHEDKRVELLVANAIKIIERYSHVKGLSDKVREFLEENIKKLKNPSL